MPIILPIEELRDPDNVSKLVKKEKGPVYFTRDGYGEIVVIDIETYNELVDLLKPAPK